MTTLINTWMENQIKKPKLVSKHFPPFLICIVYIVRLTSGQVPGSRDPISEIVCSYGVPYVYLEALELLASSTPSLLLHIPEKHVHTTLLPQTQHMEE